jgi:hypothetical protein
MSHRKFLSGIRTWWLNNFNSFHHNFYFILFCGMPLIRSRNLKSIPIQLQFSIVRKLKFDSSSFSHKILIKTCKYFETKRKYFMIIFCLWNVWSWRVHCVRKRENFIGKFNINRRKRVGVETHWNSWNCLALKIRKALNLRFYEHFEKFVKNFELQFQVTQCTRKTNNSRIL